jgi:hypothetical protein
MEVGVLHLKHIYYNQAFATAMVKLENTQIEQIETASWPLNGDLNVF